METKLIDIKTLITAFVLPNRRDRYLALIQSKRGLGKFYSQLAHFNDFDPRFIMAISPRKQNALDIEKELRVLGAPRTCFLLSENKQLTSIEVDLHFALEAVVGKGFGSVVCCLPHALAYYEGETPTDRFILSRRLTVRS